MAAEKVAENIVEDLFTGVLDWTIGDLNNQLGYADIVLSRLGIKYLILEVKRPGALAWNRRAVDAALDQARHYADEQRVRCIGATDGLMLADDRRLLFTALGEAEGAEVDMSAIDDNPGLTAQMETVARYAPCDSLKEGSEQA